MDMSKAFDTLNRKKLIEDLENILEKDELHLVKIMLQTNLTVRCGKAESEHFTTDTGAPQGDCLSAIEFTLYLAKTLEKTKDNKQDHNYHNEQEPPRAQNKKEHNYNLLKENIVEINQEYADDISTVTTSQEIVQKLKKDLPPKLEQRNLHCNTEKTEEYTIELNGKNNDDWKKCKMLGSLLNTSDDIKRRKNLALDALRNMKSTFENKKLSIKTKARIFNTYIASIFLYNAELWTLNTDEENKIDSFQRRLLRSRVLNVRWPRIVKKRRCV